MICSLSFVIFLPIKYYCNTEEKQNKQYVNRTRTIKLLVGNWYLQASCMCEGTERSETEYLLLKLGSSELLSCPHASYT